MYVTDFAGVNLNGKSFFIPASQEYQFKTFLDPNDPGTFTWTINGSYEITGGSTSSTSVTVRWAAPGIYSVAVVYVGGGNTLSSSTTVTVSSNSTELTTRTCADEASAASVSGQIPSYIDFANKTGEVIKIYWINYSGQRTLYHTLQPG
ncbi:MAG: PKD domain-containing protein [Pyrinomonadaceae bacterium]